MDCGNVPGEEMKQSTKYNFSEMKTVYIKEKFVSAVGFEPTLPRAFWSEVQRLNHLAMPLDANSAILVC